MASAGFDYTSLQSFDSIGDNIIFMYCCVLHIFLFVYIILPKTKCLYNIIKLKCLQLVR